MELISSSMNSLHSSVHFHFLGRIVFLSRSPTPSAVQHHPFSSTGIALSRWTGMYVVSYKNGSDEAVCHLSPKFCLHISNEFTRRMHFSNCPTLSLLFLHTLSTSFLSVTLQTVFARTPFDILCARISSF